MNVVLSPECWIIGDGVDILLDSVPDVMTSTSAFVSASSGEVCDGHSRKRVMRRSISLSLKFIIGIVRMLLVMIVE